MKKWLAYICIMIFSMQVIPVKEIGKILFKGQITEEEVAGYGHSSDEPYAPKLKKDGDPLHISLTTQAHFRVDHLTHVLSTAIHEADNLPIHFVADILTPPPNFAS